MELQDNRQWQELHRRTVVGEMLTPSEQEAYETGCHELDAEEVQDGSVEKLRKLREQIGSAAREQQELREREAELDARIATLEARLDARTRQLLGIGI